jgi:hypothetical protein
MARQKDVPTLGFAAWSIMMFCFFIPTSVGTLNTVVLPSGPLSPNFSSCNKSLKTGEESEKHKIEQKQLNQIV